LREYREIVGGRSAEEVDATCPICLSEFDLDEKLRVLPCKHHFHDGCVDEWLRVNSTCPSCRRDIDPQSNSPADDEENANLGSGLGEDDEEEEEVDERVLELAPLVNAAS
jgi:hypothetical protein